ncbi:MAG: hypothetical protein R2787_00230 [Saprospiraceae bacterium]
MTFTVVTTPGNCPGNYIETRTWIAIDNCDNATTHVQKITFVDDEPPVFSNVPVDMTVDCSNIPPIVDPTATDNCSGVFIAFNEAFLPGPCAGNFTLTRTWVAEDDCGNSVSVQQVVVVTNDSEPQFDSVPGDITVECDNIPTAPTLTANDCGANVDVTYTEVRIDGLRPHVVRTWTVQMIAAIQQR